MPRALWAKAPAVLLHHRSVLAAVVCASALVALAAAGGPLLRAAVESEALKAQLADLSPIGAGLEVETPLAVGDAATDAARRRAARALAETLPFSSEPVIATTTEARLVQRGVSATDQVAVVIMARDGAREHVRRLSRVVDGAWLAQSVARPAGLRPGDRVEIASDNYFGPGAPDQVRSRTKVTVGAIYLSLEADRDNPYWTNFLPRIRGTGPDPALLPTFLLVDRATAVRLATRVGGGLFANTYEFPVASSSITPSRAKRLARAYEETRRTLLGRNATARSLGCDPDHGLGCTADSSLESAVQLAERSVDALSPVLALLASFTSLIAVAAAVVAGIFNVRRRDGEARLSVARGESRIAYAARTLLEAAIPSVIGTLAGLALAAALLRALAPAGTVDAGVARQAVAAALLGLAVALAAIAAGAWTARGPTLAREGRSHVRRIPWELAPLTAAALTYVLVRRGGGLVENEALGSHPRLVVLLFPLFLAAGVAGLLVRVVQRVVRRRDARSHVVFLALRRLAAARGLVVLLTVTTAVAFAAVSFAEILDRSLASNSLEKATVANGADVQGLVDPQQSFPSSFPVPIARVVETFDTVSVDGLTVEAIVSDPEQLRRVVRWQWPHDPRPALETVSESDAVLPVIASPALAGTTAIRIGGRTLPVRVVATRPVFPGSVAHRDWLFIPSEKLEAAEDRAGMRGDPLSDAITFVWARGEPREVSRLLAASPIAPEYITTVAYFLHNADLSTASRAYGFIRVVALGAAFVSLAALVLYLYARARTQRITGAFLERMGFGAGRQALSTAGEAAALVAFSALAGAGAALAASAQIVERVDPLPRYAPGASLDAPWLLLIGSYLALVAAAAVVGALAGGLAARGEVGEALRVA